MYREVRFKYTFLRSPPLVESDFQKVIFRILKISILQYFFRKTLYIRPIPTQGFRSFNFRWGRGYFNQSQQYQKFPILFISIGTVSWYVHFHVHLQYMWGDNKVEVKGYLRTYACVYISTSIPYIQPYLIRSSLETWNWMISLEFHGKKKSIMFHVVFRDGSFRDTFYKVSTWSCHMNRRFETPIIGIFSVISAPKLP